MANKMLIDASHPEETRVVAVRGQKVEEFDFEAANRRQLRGNIYLAKVTRVEPSLQAAFIEYGGNRHGFLAFGEIHPDYYQIPVADRQALLEDEARFEREQERDDERRRSRRSRSAPKKAEGEADGEGETVSADAEGAEDDESGENADEAGAEELIEQVGGDAMEEVRERPRHHRRQYKIQEVIKRRQILLVQVVKEERGTKGAALTTYLSLAGRYSVLMPNSGKGGGISRKITNATDRKRLKEIAQDLEVPEGMGIILRTAGAARTKAEIKRDYEYLMRLWESVRELTLTSAAPALVYEEGSLVKRAIRDLYNKDTEEVLVAGDEAYREAKDFMRMLMPSHAKVVKPYREPTPLFAKYGVEQQLDAMFSNHVQLKSGGYLVISPTEALVSIDVNSGRSTREHNIEDTALRTNLEAAEEITRQLRLRDLAGLIVIDFIDMEEKRNNRSVEKNLSECLKTDRARIQVGRISAFGLLEMSRQRIRTGVLESSSILCPHCAGTGFVRATASVALHILRSVEETLLKSATHNLVIRTRTEVAFYMLNQKRAHLRELETRFGVMVSVHPDESLGSTTFVLDRGEMVLRTEAPRAPVTSIQVTAVTPVDEPEDEEVESDEAEAETEAAATSERPNGGPQAQHAEGEGGRRRRRRRRRRGGRNGEAREGYVHAEGGQGGPEAEGSLAETDAEGEDEGEEAVMAGPPADVDAAAVTELGRNEAEGAPAEAEAPASEDEAGGRRRRARRGGRGRGREAAAEVDAGEAVAAETPPVAADSEEAAPRAPAKRPRRGRRERIEIADGEAAASPPEPVPAPIAVEAEAPANGAAATEPTAPEPVLPEPEPVAVVLTPPDPDRPKRAGWWSKAKAALSGG